MSDGYRDDGTGTEDWGVTRITEQVAAWPSVPSSTLDNQQFYRRRSAAYSQRLRTTAEALRELYALVEGECPALLDEDRGGTVRLAMDCDAILARLKQEGLT